MREILFRAKRKDNGEWVYGYFSPCCFGRFPCTPAIIPKDKMDSGSWEPKEIIPETVSEFTGLTVNGVKIFEGDIIRYADRYEYAMYLESIECPEEYEGVSFEKMWKISEIVYGSEVDYPAFDLKWHDFECNGLSELLGGEYYFEVIGNIWDNPELLKGE